MSRQQLRFRPPALGVSPELDWVLLRSFGPAEAPVRSAFDPAAAVLRAEELSLAARIATRCGRSRLEHELGAELGQRLLDRRMAAAGGGLQLAASVRQLSEVASKLGVPFALLKFAALRFIGVLAPGTRSAQDVDVLVSAEQAAELQRELEAAGYEASDQGPTEQHLPLLDHPQLGQVEVHFRILGVRSSPGNRSITFDELEKLDLLDPVEDLPASCRIPERSILTAHALVHGIAQHGFSPTAYSLAWMLGDLIDLGLAGDAGGELARRAAAWIAKDVSAGEVAATRELCCRLSDGEPLAGAWLDSPAGQLLRHLLAGVFDPAYEASLRGRQLVNPVTDRPRALAVAGFALRSLAPSEGEIAKIYGRPQTRPELLKRRLLRPFDLVVRLARIAANALRVRLRRGA